MIEFLANLLFTLESIEKKRIAFDFGVRNLESDHVIVAHVTGAVNAGHSAAGHEFFDSVVVELIAGMESHRENAGR